ncbi:hypothetical protein GALMADRAFT_215525 [Galerina marginata CBS 339.88]|uniref:Uncharacterized protein n=1 Tax=Galerina marginata (strain CBS 339.88) TaxID=685588 RepID=A0A067SG64_GALM3|nr:hypothetical protein GALMADRAFT_215525 [Galerina marginata CBS 339.88]
MPKIPQLKNVDRATLRWSALKTRSDHPAHTNIVRYTCWVSSMPPPTANINARVPALQALQAHPHLGNSQPVLQPAMPSLVPLQSPAAPVHATNPYRVISPPYAAVASLGVGAPSRTVPKPSNANKGNLQSILGLAAEDFLTIQALIHSFAKALLDVSSTLKGQKGEKLKELCKQKIPQEFFDQSKEPDIDSVVPTACEAVGTFTKLGSAAQPI